MNESIGLEKIISNAIASSAFPGCTYAVVTDSKITYGCYGYRDIYPTKVENTIDTIYDLASLTKVVSTTTLIMQLVEQGLIRIHQSVSQVLPNFRFNDITIWNLLTHTSGLPAGITGRKDLMSYDDVINQIFNKIEPNDKPGMHIVYSDINFILLGLIIEKITNTPLDEYAKKNLFEPLNMIDTSYKPTDTSRCAATELKNDEVLKGYCKGFVHDETAYALNQVAGHAGVFSTIKDLTNFVLMILNDGIFNNKKILSKASIDLLFTTQVKEQYGVECLPKVRSIGWQKVDLASSCGELTSQNTIVHTGFTGTNIFVDRTNRIGFILLTNRVHPSRTNNLHLNTRAQLANYIMSHQEEFK